MCIFFSSSFLFTLFFFLSRSIRYVVHFTVLVSNVRTLLIRHTKDYMDFVLLVGALRLFDYYFFVYFIFSFFLVFFFFFFFCSKHSTPRVSPSYDWPDRPNDRRVFWYHCRTSLCATSIFRFFHFFRLLFLSLSLYFTSCCSFFVSSSSIFVIIIIFHLCFFLYF